jgi:hypothetical protein
MSIRTTEPSIKASDFAVYYRPSQEARARRNQHLLRRFRQLWCITCTILAALYIGTNIVS